jgi:hypothetical protein
MRNDLKPGDHVYVSYDVFTHHGIYVGDGSVVELYNNWKKRSGTGSDVPRIRRISLGEFANGREVKVRQYPPSECDPPHVVVERALSRLGEEGYNLFNNNCEHFATWCKMGEPRSSQVETFARRGMSLYTKLLAKPVVEALVKQGLKATAKLAPKAPFRLGMPLLFAPDLAQVIVEHTSATIADADPKTAETLGKQVGVITSLGLGWAIAGPMGAAVLGGCWLLGELAGWFLHE